MSCAFQHSDMVVWDNWCRNPWNLNIVSTTRDTLDVRMIQNCRWARSERYVFCGFQIGSFIAFDGSVEALVIVLGALLILVLGTLL